MVLINGGNFIDGLNTLLIKYFILIYLILFISLSSFIPGSDNFIKNLILVLVVLLCLNSFGIIYMGDSWRILNFIADWFLFNKFFIK